MQVPRKTPIERGSPLAGTWQRSFERVDLLEIRRPFSKPLPRAFNDSRIKEWQSFLVQDDCFCFGAILSNLKLYRWAQVFLFDKEKGERLWFRKLLPLSGWRLPQTLSNAAVDSRSYGFFFRIHNWLDANTIKVDLDIEATRTRPSFTAHVEYDMDEKKIDPLVVNLLFSERRCLYVYRAFAPVRGDMVFGGRHLSLERVKTSGIFCDYKGYYPYRMRSTWCTAFGFDNERRYGFAIAENQAKETYKNNENALWIDERIHYLPPVRITRPNGLESDWIIQDMDGMVDLVFTPKELIRNEFSLIFSKAEYNSPIGYYNGMVVTSEGEQIHVRNLWGSGEKLYLRV